MRGQSCVRGLFLVHMHTHEIEALLCAKMPSLYVLKDVLFNISVYNVVCNIMQQTHAMQAIYIFIHHKM